MGDTAEHCLARMGGKVSGERLAPGRSGRVWEEREWVGATERKACDLEEGAMLGLCWWGRGRWDRGLKDGAVRERRYDLGKE